MSENKMFILGRTYDGQYDHWFQPPENSSESSSNVERAFRRMKSSKLHKYLNRLQKLKGRNQSIKDESFVVELTIDSLR